MGFLDVYCMDLDWQFFKKKINSSWIIILLLVIILGSWNLSFYLSVWLSVCVCVCVVLSINVNYDEKYLLTGFFFFPWQQNKKLPQETKTRMKVITLGLIMKSFFRAPACISEIIIKYAIFSWDRHIISCPVLLFAAPHLVSFLLQNWTWTWESRYRLS